MHFEEEFNEGKRKKSVLWGVILGEIKKAKPDFIYNRDEITKKFLNLMVTYKRIKKRMSESGREATTWEYFESFDQIYGTKHFMNPPTELLASSSQLVQEVSENEDDPSSVSDQPSSTPKQRKEKKDDVTSILKAQEKEDERRHQELIAVERDRVQAERERTEVLKDIKNLLQEILQK